MKKDDLKIERGIKLTWREELVCWAAGIAMALMSLGIPIAMTSV